MTNHQPLSSNNNYAEIRWDGANEPEIVHYNDIEHAAPPPVSKQRRRR
jgi:hypothetical protein